jgi:metallo-beta-lactamase class B
LKPIAAVTLTLSLALGSTLTAAAADTDLPPNWTARTEPFEIFEDVYWVGTEGLAAILFTSVEGHILLDTGMPESAADVMASIESLGFEVTDIRYLLNTQAHYDHCGGFAEVKAASGARMLASEGDHYALEKGVYEGWESRNDLNFTPVLVDGMIEDGDTVTVGDVILTAHLTPGHSPGCTSWSFTGRDGAEEYRALMFCSGSVALNKLAPEQYPGIVDDYRNTFAAMKALPVDAYLAPHAEQFGLAEKRARLATEGARAFVDPAEKDRRIAEFEQAFESALAEQSERH